ncbi:hypothetical protein EJB05_36301, partial [Eragrostis curvula]
MSSRPSTEVSSTSNPVSVPENGGQGPLLRNFRGNPPKAVTGRVAAVGHIHLIYTTHKLQGVSKSIDVLQVQGIDAYIWQGKGIQELGPAENAE